MNGTSIRRWAGQAVAYTLFAALIGYFSNAPAYQHLPPDEALIKLSLRHSGQLLGECRTLAPEELARLPPTMRAPKECPRERSPLTLELEVNGQTVLAEQVPPRGLHKDGMASMYRRLSVPAGEVMLKVRMKDHSAQSEFPYTAERTLDLAPAQVLVIDFDSQSGRFEFL
jgi:hypothetical protein